MGGHSSEQALYQAILKGQYAGNIQKRIKELIKQQNTKT